MNTFVLAIWYQFANLGIFATYDSRSATLLAKHTNETHWITYSSLKPCRQCGGTARDFIDDFVGASLIDEIAESFPSKHRQLSAQFRCVVDRL